MELSTGLQGRHHEDEGQEGRSLEKAAQQDMLVKGVGPVPHRPQSVDLSKARYDWLRVRLGYQRKIRNYLPDS